MRATLIRPCTGSFKRWWPRWWPSRLRLVPRRQLLRAKLRRSPWRSPSKSASRKIQRDSTSENSESAEENSEEEQLIYIPKHLRQSKRPVEEPLSVNKPKYGPPAEDSIQALTKNSQRPANPWQRKKGHTPGRISTSAWKGTSIWRTSLGNSLSLMDPEILRPILQCSSAECARFSEDNRALFLCFPRSLEGIAAKWYAEHVNPIELRDFDKVVNMFVERFLFNTEALPTLNHLCNLKQEPNEKGQRFHPQMEEPLQQNEKPYFWGTCPPSHSQ